MNRRRFRPIELGIRRIGDRRRVKQNVTFTSVGEREREEVTKATNHLNSGVNVHGKQMEQVRTMEDEEKNSMMITSDSIQDM